MSSSSPIKNTDTRVHFVIFVIFIKINIFPFSTSILTFSTQNHLILTYFTHFDTTHFFYYNISERRFVYFSVIETDTATSGPV
jgi:uncharacterized membrane protein